MSRSEEYHLPESRTEAIVEQNGHFLSHVNSREKHQHEQQQLRYEEHEGNSTPLIRNSPLKASSTTPRRPSPIWQATHHLSPSTTTATTRAAGSPIESSSITGAPLSPSTGLIFTSTPQECDLVPPPSPTPPRRVSSPGVLSSQIDSRMGSPQAATASTRRRSKPLSESVDLNGSGQSSPDHLMLTPGHHATGIRRFSAPRLVDVPMLSPECSQLGKHPKTPSPDEPRSRIKGIKTLTGKAALDPPLRMPDFSVSPDKSDLSSDLPLLSPTPRPRAGLLPTTSPLEGLPKKGLFLEEISRLSSKGHSTRHKATDADADNPFLQLPEKREITKGDVLTSSQWRSERAHHLTKEYLDAFFRQDRVVMFADKDMEDDPEDFMEKRYRIIRPFLSNGEFSDVIRVEDKKTGATSVVKRLKKTIHGAMERKRFLNEVYNFWRVVPNPNIIQLQDAWEQQGRIYMMMELCEYGSLHAIMMDYKLRGGFSEDIIWRCLSNLAWGLRAIHDMNILHLDFKPANAFVDSRGVIKIGDFGHSCERPVLDTDGKEGDRCYMAQELLQGHCDYYSDVFSLGVTIFEMACNRVGDLPGEGPEWHRIRDGNLDFDLLLSSKWDPQALPMVLPVISPPPEPSLSQEKAALSTPAIDSDSAPPTPTVTAAPSLPPRASLKFSQTLLDLISDMMQPEFDSRPLINDIISNPRLLHAFPTSDSNNDLGYLVSREGALASLLKPSYSIC